MKSTKKGKINLRIKVKKVNYVFNLDEIQLTKEFLDDWSQSNLPKSIVLNKAYNRIRSFDL